MAQIELHPDFKDFLRLQSSHGVKYLVVGGYAVEYYGYPRATADMDIWIVVDEVNAEKTARMLRDFGMPEKESINWTVVSSRKLLKLLGFKNDIPNCPN